MVLLNNNVKSGSYCIKNKHNIKISDLIKFLNNKLSKKIKVKYLNKSIISNYHNNFRILPKWKPVKNLKNKILKIFQNEIN